MQYSELSSEKGYEQGVTGRNGHPSCIEVSIDTAPDHEYRYHSLYSGYVGDGDAGDDCISRRDDLETQASHAETAHLSMDRLPTVAFHALLSRRPVRVDVNGGISAVISVVPDLLDL